MEPEMEPGMENPQYISGFYVPRPDPNRDLYPPTAPPISQALRGLEGANRRDIHAAAAEARMHPPWDQNPPWGDLHVEGGFAGEDFIRYLASNRHVARNFIENFAGNYYVRRLVIHALFYYLTFVQLPNWVENPDNFGAVESLPLERNGYYGQDLLTFLLLGSTLNHNFEQKRNN